MVYTIGIDVSKSKLDCACRRAVDQVKSKRKSFKNESDDFGSLLTWAENLSGTDCQDIVFIVEPKKGLASETVSILKKFKQELCSSSSSVCADQAL